MSIFLATTDRADGKKKPVEEREADARLMAHPIGKSLYAETLMECHSEHEEIRHEQGPVVIGNKHAGTFGNPLKSLDHGSEIVPEERLEDLCEPMDHLGVTALQTIDIRCVYQWFDGNHDPTFMRFAVLELKTHLKCATCLRFYIEIIPVALLYTSISRMQRYAVYDTFPG